MIEERKWDEFDVRIKDRIGNSVMLPPNADNDISLELDEFADPDGTLENEMLEDASPAGWIDGDPIDNHGDLVFENPVLDTLINAEALLLYNNEI